MIQNLLLSVEFLYPTAKKTFSPSLRLFCLVMFFILNVSFAQTTRISTASGGNWNTPGTWTTGVVPAANDPVIIVSTATVNTTANRTCAGISILGTLNLATGNILTVNGDVSGTGTWKGNTNNDSARTISLNGNWSFTGTSAGTGPVAIFTGANVQTLAGTIGAAGTLNVNKTGGALSLANALTVGVFQNTAGTFDANTFLLTTSSAPTLTAGTLRVGASTWGGNYSFASPTIPTNFTVEYYSATPTISAGFTYQNLTFSGSGTTAASSGNLVIQGNLANTGTGVLNFSNRDVTISGGNTQSIAGFTTTGTVTMSKSGNTATFMGTVNGTGLTINGSGGRLALGNFTHTFTGAWAMMNGTLDGDTSTLRIGGDITGSGGSFLADNGTVELYGANQAFRNLGFYNLLLSGTAGAVKTFPATAVAISNNLIINTGIIANLNTNAANNLLHSAKTLTLGGGIKALGIWGSTLSGAVNKDDTYFSATRGRINVTSTATCTTPINYSVSVTASNLNQAYCSSEAGSTIGLSGSEIGVSYQLLRGTVNVGSPLSGTGNALVFGAFNTTGTYTVLASKTASCTVTMSSGPVLIYKYSSPPVPSATPENVSCPLDATGKITVNTIVAPASLAFISANNQYINFGSNILSNRSTFSIEGWIKYDPTKYIDRMSLFGQNDAIEVGFEGDFLKCWTQSGGSVQISKSEFTTNDWYHIAVTGDGQTGGLKMYINGVLKASGGSATSNYSSNTSFTTKIGYGVMDEFGVGLTGEVFKLGFWNKVLSTGEISTLSSGFVEYDASLSGLLAGYSFIEGTGTTVSGVGSLSPVPTGTFVNTPKWTDPYSYSWTSSPAGYTSNSISLTGLTARTYNLTTSLRGCSTTGSWTINVTNTVPSVSSHPIDATVCAGNNTSFTVTAVGSTLTYQWQVSTDGGTSFSNLGNTAVYSNVTTATLNITGATVALNSYRYRCVVSGICSPSATSNAGILTVNPASTLVLTSGSANQTVCSGTAISSIVYTFGGGATGAVVTGLPSSMYLINPTAKTVTISGTPAAGTTYSVATQQTSPCAAVSLGGAITVNPASTLVLSSGSASQAICSGTALATIVYTWGGGATGVAVTGLPTTLYSVDLPAKTVTISGTPAAGATYTIATQQASPCTVVSLGGTITLNPVSTLVLTSTGGSSTQTVCSGIAISPIVYTWGGAATGVDVTGLPAGLNFTPNSGAKTVTISGTPTAGGNYTVTTQQANSCAASLGGIINLNVGRTAPTAGVTKQASCADNTAIITVTNPAPNSGYHYSIDGSNYSNDTGVFTRDISTTQSYSVTVKDDATGCISAAASVTLNAPTTKVWNGSVDVHWSTAGNWTPNGAPQLTDCITIPDLTSIANKPAIKQTASATDFYTYKLSIADKGSLIIESGKTLNVTNSVNVNTGGSLIFENNSSLVQKDNVPNTGVITYKRNTTPVYRYDITFWSSPLTLLSGFTLHDLSPDTLGDKYTSYDPVSGWVIHPNGGVVMIPGKGYNVRAPQTYDPSPFVKKIYPASFIGVPNNGDVPVTPTANQWNLIGNPYPSAIKADKLLSTYSHIGPLYFWTHGSPPVRTADPNDVSSYYSSNDYAVYTGTGGTVTDPQASNDGNIAAGQGFFIYPNAGTDIIFNNDMRLSGVNSAFFKPAETAEVEKNRIWLNCSNIKGAFKQTLVGYVEGATNSWDFNFDASTLDENEFLDFYSIEDTDLMAIQGRALPFNTNDLVPLGYKSTIAGDFTISIDHADGLFNSQAVYLEDKTTNIIHDLTAGNYTFTTTVGTFDKRFVLRYTSGKTLGTGDFENIQDGLLVAVKDKVIKVTAVKEPIKEVSIYDISGKLIYQKKKVGNTELTISNLQSSNQVLLVKITLENDFTAARKVIFH